MEGAQHPQRLCPACGQAKPASDFAPNRSRSSGVQATCQACYAVYQSAYYRLRTANDSEFRERNRRVRQQRRAALILQNRSQVWAYLASHPCIDCGEADPLVLEFDHRVPDIKRFAIGDALFRKAWVAIEAEIGKCDVRCANCHRRRTARQQGFYRYMPSSNYGA